MSYVKNAVPTPHMLQTDDQSKRSLPPQVVPLPDHIPHFYTFAPKGDSVPRMVGVEATQIYGDEAFSENGAYTTTNTPYINAMLQYGNTVMMQRLIPDDAPDPASLCLFLDVVADKVPLYKRGSDDKLLLDENGDKIPELDGMDQPVLVDGHRIKWTLGSLEQGAMMGQASQKVGSMTAADGTQSVIYPMFEFRATDVGAIGNLFGINIFGASVNDIDPLNLDVVYDQKAMVYRMRVKKRVDVNSSALVHKTVARQEYFEFALKPGAVNSAVDQAIDLKKRFPAVYDIPGSPGINGVKGPFEGVYIYQDNVDKIHKDLYAAERAGGFIEHGDDGEYMMNIFTGKDEYGISYQTVAIAGMADGGFNFSPLSDAFMSGGGDGTMTREHFEELVLRKVSTYGEDYALASDAMYPLTTFWDTGFAKPVKDAIFNILSVRDDVALFMATQDTSQPINDPTEDTSMGIALRARAMLTPESVVYGTPCMRVLLFARAGYIENSKYELPVPSSYEFAHKLAEYMGASNGKWRPGFAPNVPGRNHIQFMSIENNKYLPYSVCSKDWEIGLIVPESYDHVKNFFPAFQTVYPFDTSVLNSAFSMLGTCSLKRVARRTWRDMTGIDYMTNSEIENRSNELILKAVENKYDSRFNIIPETYHTPLDGLRGFSYSCNIRMQASNPKTVATFTVTAERKEN